MERFENKRIWLGAGGVVAALIIAVGWFMFIGPERSSTDNLNAQAAATRQQNTLLQTKVHQLQVKNSHVAKYTASLRSALQALPFDSGLPAFTRQLNAQAVATGVVINSVVVGGVTAVGSSTAAATPTPAAAASSAPNTPATTPQSAGSIYSIAVTVSSNGPLSGQLAFLNAMRSVGPRRALVTATQFSPGLGAQESSIDGAAALTTTLTVFSAPQSSAQIVALKKLLSGKIGN